MRPFTMRTFTIWLARVGLIVIAVVTFVTSFDAITATAAATGAVSPHLAWAIPIAIDGLILVGSAVAWTEAIDDDWHPFPLLTVGGAAGLSVWANVAHAAGAPVLGQVLAAVPPIALIVSVELGAWQMRRSLKRTRQADALESSSVPTMPAALDREHDAAYAEVTSTESMEYGEATEFSEPDAEEWDDRETVPQQVDEVGRQPEPQMQPEVAAERVRTTARATASSERASPATTPDSRVAQPQEDGALMEQIADYVGELGHRPTQREIAEALGLSRASVRRAINAEPEVWHRLGRLTTAGNGQGAAASR
jgi:hypothetical protein